MTPVADGVSEGDETVVVTLLDDVRYNLGSSTVASITISDPPTPVVTVTAFDPDAAEAGLETGIFRFTRTGDLGVPLTVTLHAWRHGLERHRLRQHRRHGDLQHRPGDGGPRWCRP